MRRPIGTLLLAAGVATLVACGDDTPSAPTLSLTQVASGLNSALYVTAPPGDTNRIFVVQQSGAIRVVRRDTLLPTLFLNLSGIISTGGERGLLSLAFDPNYASNGFFYVDYTASNGALTVARYHISANPNVGDATSGQVLLSIPHAANSNHNGGLVTFGPDGYLYIGTGDGGGGGDPDDNGQDSTVLLGKILRIDVNGAPPYAIPASNPFVGRPPAAPEVWAYGLRNPWRFSFDRMTHDLYIGDVGQNAWEELNFASCRGPGRAQLRLEHDGGGALLSARAIRARWPASFSPSTSTATARTTPTARSRAAMSTAGPDTPISSAATFSASTAPAGSAASACRAAP